MNKKYLISGIIALGILCGIQVATTQATTCLFGAQGGTGLCTATSSNIGQAPVITSILNGTPVYSFSNAGGSSSGTAFYVNGTLYVTTSSINFAAGSNITITTSTVNGIPSFTITGVAASGTFTQIYGIAPIVVTQVGANASTSCPTCVTTTTGLLSTTTAATLYYPLSSNPAGYVTSTGILSYNVSSVNPFISVATTTTSAALTYSSSSLNLGTAATRPLTDFLPSSTIYVVTVNGVSGAVTITSTTLGVYTNTNQLINGAGFTNNTGTVSSLSSGYAITLSPSTITTTGTIAVNTSTLTTFINTFGFSTSSGAGLTGNATSTYVAVYTTAGSLLGYSNLTYTSSTGVLSLNGNPVVNRVNTLNSNYFLLGGGGSTVQGNGDLNQPASGQIQYDTTPIIDGFNGTAGNYLYGVSTTQPITGAAGTFTKLLVNGQATTTNLSITAITGTQCLHAVNGAVSGTGSDCGAGGSTSGTIQNATANQIGLYQSTSTLYGTSTLTYTPGSPIATSSITFGSASSTPCLITGTASSTLIYTHFLGTGQIITSVSSSSCL